MRALVVGRDPEGMVAATEDEDECMAYDEDADMLCMLPEDHDGPHWDPFDRVLWVAA